MVEGKMAEAYRQAFSHVVVVETGRWMCYVTGHDAPCGCFACNASARKGCEAAKHIQEGRA